MHKYWEPPYKNSVATAIWHTGLCTPVLYISIILLFFV